jgi:hypothetical protein
MQRSPWEIIILKPTQVFLSFLNAQSPEVVLPSLQVLQTNTTAYTIRKQEDDEATLDEIERHFAFMFRHEICRWLGEEDRNEVEASFLDFLCCFKFELHSQIVLMEPSINEGQHLLCIKPSSVLLKWMKTSIEEESEGDTATIFERVSLSHLTENATVVIKNFKELSEIKPFIKQYYRPIFKAEMLRMCDRAELWPEINSFEDFSRYFSVEIHSQLLHLH